MKVFVVLDDGCFNENECDNGRSDSVCLCKSRVVGVFRNQKRAIKRAVELGLEEPEEFLVDDSM